MGLNKIWLAAYIGEAEDARGWISVLYWKRYDSNWGRDRFYLELVSKLKSSGLKLLILYL